MPVCHIPPVQEAELMRRFEADEKGERDSGLAAWQCRRCTKKARVEPPTLSTPQAGSTRPQLLQHTSVDSESLSSRVPQTTRPSSQGSVPTVIEIDDDVEMVDVVSNPARPSTIPPTAVGGFRALPNPPGPSLATIQAPSTAAGRHEGVPNSLHTASNPEQRSSTSAQTSGPNKSKGKKRATRAPSAIAPTIPRKSAADEVRPSSPYRREMRGTMAPPPTLPTVTSHPGSKGNALIGGAPANTVPSAPSAAPMSADALRERISGLRAAGRLEPPQEYDYVFRRPRSAQETQTRASSTERSRTANLDLRSRTRDLAEVESKLEDFADEPMDIGIAPASDSATVDRNRDRDTHDIEDMYGDVAPRFRSVRPTPRAPSSAPPRNCLLFALQHKLLSDPDRSGPAQLRMEETPREHRRKFPARQLEGKTLIKKQAEGLVFDARTVDWGSGVAGDVSQP
ncbi:hypothetical protein C8Q77DRAFT_926609 [Trametes polyzona]|nr:hypothetical protein C8Q77DRAFT_926609 [Trametes polyzona]